MISNNKIIKKPNNKRFYFFSKENNNNNQQIMFYVTIYALELQKKHFKEIIILSENVFFVHLCSPFQSVSDSVNIMSIYKINTKRSILHNNIYKIEYKKIPVSVKEKHNFFEKLPIIYIVVTIITVSELHYWKVRHKRSTQHNIELRCIHTFCFRVLM